MTAGVLRASVFALVLCIAWAGHSTGTFQGTFTGSTTKKEVPYTKPTNIPDTIATSCEQAGPTYLLIPDPENCKKFIVCLNGHGTRFDCPEPLFFSYKKQRCEWPAQAECVQPTTTTTTTAFPYTRPTNIPAVEPTSCETAGVNYVFITDPKDCSKFIVCLEDESWSFECPDGLFFNYQEQRCDWTASPGCVPSTTPLPVPQLLYHLNH